MRRRFPLVDVINLNVLRLQEAGIIGQILRDVHRNSSKFEIPKKIESKPQKKLTVTDMHIIGFLLIVGYLIAFAVFLGELIVSCVERKKVEFGFIS